MRVCAIVMVLACLAGVVLTVSARKSPSAPSAGVILPADKLQVGALSISYEDLTGRPSAAQMLKSAPVSGELPTVGTLTELLRMFNEMNLFYAPVIVGDEKGRPEMALDGGAAVPPGGMISATAAPAAPVPAPSLAATDMDGRSSAGPGYSETNTQVAGVDEGDVVKTDGQHIYAAGFNQIAIIRADAADMTVLSRIDLGQNSYFQEMYIDGDRLVAVCTRSEQLDGGDAYPPDMPHIMIWRPAKQFTCYVVYDITDRANPRETRRVELEGSSVSTRLIDGTLYFVTNKWLSAIPYTGTETQPEAILPAYTDSATGDTKISVIGPERIVYCPGELQPTYMLVGAFDIAGGEPVEPEAFLGAGSNIYVSPESLYVAKHSWADGVNKTVLLRFAIDGPKVGFVASAEVPGNLLNQYSMDEYEGTFRVATTSWSETGNFNNVYVLRTADMNRLGQLENLAPGESIQSARFMGETAYVVTYRQVDPLFVIDLKNPAAPTVLGELKVPGFSQYLHPIGDGLLVGFGRHTQEMYVRDDNGKEVVVGTRDGGMKLSMFDVSDPHNPKELHTLKIGTSNSYSEVSNNPRALMVDAGRKLFAFPLESYGDYDFTVKQVSEAWRGGLVVSASREKGFTQLVKLTESTANDGYYYGYQRRLCYIGDTLYMAGNGGITAYNYSTFTQTGQLSGLFEGK